MKKPMEVVLLHGTVDGMCYATLGDQSVAARGLENTVSWLLKLVALNPVVNETASIGSSLLGEYDDGATAAVHSEPQ